MKPRLPVLGLLASGLLAGLAVVTWDVWSVPGPAGEPDGLPAKASRSRPVPAKSVLEAGRAAQHPSRPLSPDDMGSGMESVVRVDPHEASKRPLQPPSLMLSETELQARAARVEQAANRDLQQLVSLLELSEAQQDRIFNTLVRRSPEWHPAMQPVGVGSSGPPAPPAVSGPGQPPVAVTDPLPEGPADRPLLDDIASELTPDQQEELANAELDRIAWWEEIIPKLLPTGETPVLEVASGTDSPARPPGSGTAAAAAPPPPAPETLKDGGDLIILD